MSATEVRIHIQEIRNNMGLLSVTSRQGEGYIITYDFLELVNRLLESYGEFLGKIKARHIEHLEEFNEYNKRIMYHFKAMNKSSEANYSFKQVNLAIGEISGLLSFGEELEGSTERKVAVSAYNKLAKENETLTKMNELLIKHRGLPELNELLTTGKEVGLPIDEHWVLALCSSNLIESLVNKKLEELNEAKDGNFRKRYNRLATKIKEKEGRDVSQLLPMAVYDGIRNKLDHASHANIVTQDEANQVCKIVTNLIAELFQ